MDRRNRKAQIIRIIRIIQIIQIARMTPEGPVEDKINVFFPHSKIIILSFLKYIDITMIMMIACG